MFRSDVQVSPGPTQREPEPALKADWLTLCLLPGGGSRAAGPLAVLAEAQFQLPVLVRPYSDSVDTPEKLEPVVTENTQTQKETR